MKCMTPRVAATRLGAVLVASLAAGPLAAEEAITPIDQGDLNAMVLQGDPGEAFEFAFEAGDELTEFSFDESHGVGANIGEGRRFTRIPRADLTGAGEWAHHFPAREGGANATSCIACHNSPGANGAGDVAVNVILDPTHSGDPSLFLERNTLPLFALGAPQRAAEEMSAELVRQRDALSEKACEAGAAETQLQAKGVDFGTLRAERREGDVCEVAIDVAGLEGVDEDLVVRPFGWKGNHATIRGFTREAAHNELGLQGVELVGTADGDFDGVTSELSVGDMTALTIYMAGLERPVSTLELADLGLMEMSNDEIAEIKLGEEQFGEVGCANCHRPELALNDPTFREPSATPGYFDETFVDGSEPGSHGLTGAAAIAFDMSKDQPNNRIEFDGGEHHLGALPIDASGRTVARLYSDLKRHDMGPELADPADPLGIGAAMWLTRPLAGVGSTGPWLHDGRATTLDAAILAHGGDATDSRDAYLALAEEERAAVIAFLESLVIFTQDEEEEPAS